MSSPIIRRAAAPFTILAVVFCAPAVATARTTYCSPSGDLCYGALDKGAKVSLRLTLMAGYFTPA